MDGGGIGGTNGAFYAHSIDFNAIFYGFLYVFISLLSLSQLPKSLFLPRSDVGATAGRFVEFSCCCWVWRLGLVCWVYFGLLACLDYVSVCKFLKRPIFLHSIVLQRILRFASAF